MPGRESSVARLPYASVDRPNPVDDPFTFGVRFATFWHMGSGDHMTTTATITAALAALLLITSCTGQPEVIEPDPKPSNSSSATPGATAPRLPKEASEQSASGAANYVRFWMSTFNYAAMTSDTEHLEEMSRECKTCLAYAEDFDRLRPSKRPDKAPWTPRKVSVATNNRGDYEVLVTTEVLGEKQTRELKFVLHEAEPFALTDIQERR